MSEDKVLTEEDREVVKTMVTGVFLFVGVVTMFGVFVLITF